MDLMVLSVQAWVNSEYTGKSGYTPITQDGITGGTTNAALITALQIEMGIPSPNGFFGPATESACPTIPSASSSKNEIYILQGALYCKGYNPNGLDGGYGNGIMTAVKKFQSDAGLTIQDGITTPMIFKALLNTDAFVLISGGDSKIRTIQQNLNRDYNSVIGLMPCDGIYSRSTNVALIKALQHEQGNSPDGFWGANTMKACPTIPGSNSTQKFMLLLQYALYCNHYNPNGFDGLFGQGFQTAIIDFQNFSHLTADGYAGGQTWASLLVSTGDNNRRGTSCDCATTITAEKAATLVNNGYTTVGRYLTGNFKMTESELNIIFDNGLKVFPIFETAGTQLSYFTSNQGDSDANAAIIAASEFGFDIGKIIYFTVDYDAMDSEVTSNIIPYFKAISDEFYKFGPPKYQIGVYGPRNICDRVSKAGYSCSSFVCDMSTGFSGNLGYSLPDNWAFDQISTITIGSGSGAIEIDNDICSDNHNTVNTSDDLPTSDEIEDDYELTDSELAEEIEDNVLLGVIASIMNDGITEFNMLNSVLLSITSLDAATRSYLSIETTKDELISRIESLKTNDVAYYAGRTITDAALAFVGALGMLASVSTIISGIAGDTLSAFGEAVSFGALTPIVTATATISTSMIAIGAAEAGFSFTLAKNAIANGLDNSGKLGSAIKSSKSGGWVRIINKEYAGKVFNLKGDLNIKYPDGVRFKESGYPDFTPYCKKSVEVKGLTGKNSDFALANQEARLKEPGFRKTRDYTWHHVENGTTMQLVSADVHRAVRHTGGACLLRRNLFPWIG